MFLTALCPTYRRPKLLENAIAQFQAQGHPDKELLILDDAQQIPEQSGDGWRLLSVATRYPSLPAKYAAITALADPRTDAFVIWEDDDIYLPWHLSAHAAALENSRWSKPLEIYTLMADRPLLETSAGRFFACTAIRRDLWKALGGMPQTLRADADLQFMAKMTEDGPAGNPLLYHERPGYCFRWASTGHYHGQAVMRGPADEGWWARNEQPGTPEPVGTLQPQFDAETQRIWEQLS